MEEDEQQSAEAAALGQITLQIEVGKVEHFGYATEEDSRAFFEQVDEMLKAGGWTTVGDSVRRWRAGTP